MAYEEYIKVLGRDVLACLILFIDKTHIDSNGRFTLEPVSVTLSIFTKEFRKKPQAWRTLGYIKNLSHGKENMSSLDKAKDYHFMLGCILGSVKDVQKKTGILWNLKYRGTYHRVVFKFPLMFVMGDTEGHDKLCGKYLNRTTNVERLCCYCNCKTRDTDDPYVSFTYTKAKHIAAFVKSKNFDRLKSCSYHPLENCFNGIEFCDKERGINGASPAESLHYWEHGVEKLTVSCVMVQKRSRKTKKRGSTNSKRMAGMKIAANKNTLSDGEDESLPDGDAVSSKDEHHYK
jgi:hypothetical protein